MAGRARWYNVPPSASRKRVPFSFLPLKLEVQASTTISVQRIQADIPSRLQPHVPDILLGYSLWKANNFVVTGEESGCSVGRRDVQSPKCRRLDFPFSAGGVLKIDLQLDSQHNSN